MGWLFFFLFLTGCIFSFASFANSPRKKIYRLIAISIIVSFFILAKLGLL
jgi:hypothetical protein